MKKFGYNKQDIKFACGSMQIIISEYTIMNIYKIYKYFLKIIISIRI